MTNQGCGRILAKVEKERKIIKRAEIGAKKNL